MTKPIKKLPPKVGATVRKYRLGEEPPEWEYWKGRSMGERMDEVMRLRAMWTPPEPMVRKVTAIFKQVDGEWVQVYSLPQPDKPE